MVRNVLFKCSLFGIYLHEFVKSDHEVHHDHPWAFATLILRGSYNEEVLVPVWQQKKFKSGVFKLVKRTVKAGQLIYRPARHIHRVVLTDNKPITLSIVFRKSREWGFWKAIGPSNVIGRMWIHWREFLNLEDGPNKKQSAM